MSKQPLLTVENLVTTFTTEEGVAKAVDGVSFSVNQGETLGIVGESGCGKSVTALSIMRLLPQPAGKITQGKIVYQQQNLVDMPIEKLRKIRGKKIAMIFQEPMTALNPVQKIGKQLAEIYQLHFSDMPEGVVRKSCIELLQQVGISDPEQRLQAYPHQLSGGMRQRVMIAMALACQPDILIADEPTTALDVTIQAQILELMKSLQQRYQMAIILITHDLAVIAETCDSVVVMYAGEVIETATVNTLFAKPKHPYTQGLLASIPKLESQPKQKLAVIEGVVPEIINRPTGCRFQNRCQYADNSCLQQQSLTMLEQDRQQVARQQVDRQQVRCGRWQYVAGLVC